MTAAVFDADDLDALIALGTVRPFPKNTVLVQEGDKSDQLYVVISGRLKVFLGDADGKEVIIDSLGPRQFFGEMALDGEPRSASVMTMEAASLCILQREQFKQFLADKPQAALALIYCPDQARANIDAHGGQSGVTRCLRARRAFADRKRNRRRRPASRYRSNFASGYREESRLVTRDGVAHSRRLEGRWLYFDG